MAKTKPEATELAVPSGGHLGENDIPNKPGTYRVTLNRKQTAWHPGSTKYEFFGPGYVEYVMFSDGGCDVYFECYRRPIPGTAG